MTKYILFISLLFIGIKGFGQHLDHIKVNGWLCCNLHDALSDISAMNNVTFNYDVEVCKGIEFNEHPYSQPLSQLLAQACKPNDLKYFVTEDSVIHIVDKWYDPTQKLITNTRTFTGKPEHFNFALTGTIIDKNTRESLPFVNILTKGTTGGTASNVDGFFTLLKVPTDTSSIELNYIGYKRKTIFLSPEGIKEKLIIEMDPEVQNIQEVVISGEKKDILQISGLQTSLIKMSPLKLNTIPNLGEKDIFRSFQLMPGISAANENSSGLYVRGGTPDQVLVQYDGFTVYNVEHMFGFFSAFNSNAIKDVQLYKGGYDAKYGGRLSSVVEITGKEGSQKGFNGAFDLSLTSVNGFVEFPIGKKTTFILAARRSWQSPIYNKIFDQYSGSDDNSTTEASSGRGGSEPTQETKSYFYDINSKLTFRPNDKDIYSISFYNGKDKLDNSIVPNTNSGRPGGAPELSAETTDLTNWGNTGTSVKWSRKISNQFYVNSLISYSNYYSLRNRSTSGSFVRPGEDAVNISRGINEDNNLIDLSGKIDAEYKMSNHHNLGFGIQTTHNDIDYSYTQNDTTEVINRTSNGQTHSTYFQDKISLFDNRVVLTPGLRYNYFTETNGHYFEPRLNMVYQLSDRFKLKGATGKYHQFAKRVTREDIAQGSRDFWVLSDNDKLPVSSSIQYIAGFSYEAPKYVIDVEGFYKDLQNVTEYSLRIDQERGSIDYSENFFTGTGVAKGIDFLVQKKYGDLTGWIAYTWSQVTSNIEEFGNYDFFASHDVTHEFKTVASYTLRNWVFSGTWIFATGKPYTAPEGGYQLNLLDGTQADYINVSVKNGNRLPNYHRLDLSATYNFTIGKSAPASISGSLFNAYNHSNVWYNEYEIVDNSIIETPVNYLGITPNITLSFKLK